tara:strand:- start:1833 stop:2360 length:528 start_codon:yes stop_codon:yes gene_type:complete
MHKHNALYRFCPLCGGTLNEKLVKQGEPERPVCAKCDFIVYLDPKVAVGTIIRNQQDEIALVKRSIEPGYGKWVFPGGYVDRGEQHLTAARREAKEEANLEINILELVGVYSYKGEIPIIIVYAASVSGGTLRAEDESSDAAWFKTGELPWPELAFKSTHDALKDYLKNSFRPFE